MFRRFRRWAQTGVFERLFQALSGDPDFEYAIIDGTIIRVHQRRTGATGTCAQAIGRSRGGLTTKTYPSKTYPRKSIGRPSP
jgi:transposase